MKKSLLKDLIYSILVSPKGLKIQYHLKHDLNKSVTSEDLAAAKEYETNVITLTEKRRALSSGTVPDAASADANSPEGVDFHKLRILGSQVVEFGRGQANVVEPTELSIGRTYKVHWKKDKPNLEMIARLYWVDGLTQRQVAEKVGVRRITVADAAKKYKTIFENRRDHEG
ncbi:MAG: hypothetical protein JNL11_02395 [Bdellovibrionaceae bacterium]|nr:hypothetical protein [Pseudobdellovibrionaceae bacterium]